MSLFNLLKHILLRKLPLTIFILGVLSVAVLSLGTYSSASAATKIVNMTPEDAAKAFVDYKALRTCLTSSNMKNTILQGVEAPILIYRDLGTMSLQNAKDIDWFYSGASALTLGVSGTNNQTDVGVYGDQRVGGNGQHDCTSAEQGKRFIAELISLTGYTSNLEFLCAIGFTRQQSPGDTTRCTVDGGTNDFVRPANPGEKLDTWWKGLGAKNLGPAGAGTGEYILYLKSFEEGCSAQRITVGTGDYKIQVASGNKMVSVDYILTDRNINSGTPIRLYSGTTKTCGELADLLSKKTNDNVRLYAAWLTDQKITPGDQTDADGAAASTSCAIPGVGWLICPFVTFLAQVTDGIYGAISALLVTDVETLTTDCSTSCGTYAAWGIMRTFANIGFVIVFLIIIFSQLTNVGVSNYGVKKLLPRLIVVAILVNISFFLLQIVIDLSNIVGGAIGPVFTSIPVFGQADTVDDSGNIFTNIAANIINGTAAATVGGSAILLAVYTGAGLLIPILLAAVVAVLVTVFILIARNVLIILLVVISPLAFLAILLPNTENLFKQWRKIIIAMLLIYPLIAVLFGASKLASNIIIASGSSSFQQLFGLAALFIPLFATPILLKNSLNAIPAIGSIASKLQSRANGSIGRKAKEFTDATPIARGIAIRKQARANYRDRKFAENLENGGPTSILARGIPGLNKLTKAGQHADKALTRSALGSADKAIAEDIKAEQDLFTAKQTTHEDLGQILQDATKSGDTIRARAAQNILLKNESGRRVFHKSMSQLESDGGYAEDDYKALQQNVKFNHPEIKASDVAIDRFGTGGTTLTAARQDASIYGGLNDGQMAGQPIENLKVAIQTGAVDVDRANRILDNPTLTQLGEGQRLELEYVTGRKARP